MSPSPPSFPLALLHVPLFQLSSFIFSHLISFVVPSFTPLPLFFSHTLSLSHALSLSHTLSHSLSLMHSLSLSHTLSHTHTLSLSLSLSHTHTLSHTLSHSLSLSLSCTLFPSCTLHLVLCSSLIHFPFYSFFPSLFFYVPLPFFRLLLLPCNININIYFFLCLSVFLLRAFFSSLPYLFFTVFSLANFSQNIFFQCLRGIPPLPRLTWDKNENLMNLRRNRLELLFLVHTTTRRMKKMKRLQKDCATTKPKFCKVF